MHSFSETSYPIICALFLSHLYLMKSLRGHVAYAFVDPGRWVARAPYGGPCLGSCHAP